MRNSKIFCICVVKLQRNNQIECYHIGCIFILQPVELLPFRIEDARRQLELNGDFSLEGLQILRDAEDERRGNTIDILMHINKV